MDEARLLLLHGLLSGGGAWAGVQAELGPDITTLAPDLPGYGAASPPAAGYSLEAVIDQLVSLVERWQPTVVVGNSMGAILALALAVKLPGAFERVGIIGLPVYSDRADGIEYLRHRSPFHGVFLRRDDYAHIGCRALHRTRTAWLPFTPAIMPGLPRYALETVFNHGEEGHAGSLDNIIFANEVEGIARKVAVPVSALHGARDSAARIDRVRALAEANNWELRVAPTGGHQLFVRRPRLTARWIRQSVLTPLTREQHGTEPHA
ncbi:MAG: hypothetical protein C0506_13815 [Anaerolinea sp.]|nr:hypothetical protein [Anaerolinea sp.]